MRRIITVIFFVLIACFAQPSEARKFALLVGVDDYANYTSLKCCVNDMKTLKEALLKIDFKESDIFLLTSGGSVRNMPTKKNIEQKVAEILDAAGPDDLVFFAFSGHGARENKTDYFYPPFAEPDNIGGTCVSITKVMDDLGKCKAKFKWMVVDACREDLSSARAARGLHIVPAPSSGIAVFQSCSKGELSYEEERDGGNGYFTKCFAEALSGAADSNHDGKLTLWEVCTWTANQTRAEVEKEENKTQRPFLNLHAADFMLTEDLNVPKARALVEEARKAAKAENYELAIQKYDEAIALCPRVEPWKWERETAQRLFNAGHGGTNKLFKPGERMTVTVNGVEFAFRWAPPGTFMMGSPESEEGRDDDETLHQVTLTQGFWMLETEVTQKQWKAVMGNNPSWFKGNGNLPVENVSWYECREFCRKCAELGISVQLPTEAQWEYACRAGKETPYFWGNSLNGNKANCDGTLPCGTTVKGKFLNRTAPVGSYAPNAWGLYDMNGNVWEFCADTYRSYTTKNVTDPFMEEESLTRCKRGGGLYDSACYSRSANRDECSIFLRDLNLGLRVVITQQALEEYKNNNAQTSVYNQASAKIDTDDYDNDDSGDGMSVIQKRLVKLQNEAEEAIDNEEFEKAIKILDRILILKPDSKYALTMRDFCEKNLPSQEDSKTEGVGTAESDYGFPSVPQNGSLEDYKEYINNLNKIAGEKYRDLVDQAKKEGVSINSNEEVQYSIYRIINEYTRLEEKALNKALLLKDVSDEDFEKLVKTMYDCIRINFVKNYEGVAIFTAKMKAFIAQLRKMNKTKCADNIEVDIFKYLIYNFVSGDVARYAKAADEIDIKIKKAGKDMTPVLGKKTIIIWEAYIKTEPHIKFPIERLDSYRKAFSEAEDPEVNELLPELERVSIRAEGSIRYAELPGKEFQFGGTFLDGTQYNAKDYAGKTVLIVIMASCPCHISCHLDTVKKMYACYHDKGFEIISVDTRSIITEDESQKFFVENNVNWKAVLTKNAIVPGIKNKDGENIKVCDYYNVTTTPRLIYIGTDGKVISTSIGFSACAKDLEEKLFKIFGDAEYFHDLSVDGIAAGERKTTTVNGVEFAFCWCPSGKFKMGSEESEEGRKSDETQHDVTLTKGFWMMETEVTQKQWKAIMGTNPSRFKGDYLPVENVSWYDCQEFCNKCTELGLPVRLPTEEQWEYACGSDSIDHLGDYAWYLINSDKKTHTTGVKEPNSLNLYDMLGNVWEWCDDWYCPYAIENEALAPYHLFLRVNRGGSWNSSASSCRRAFRSSSKPEYKDSNLGFRCVIIPDNK